MSLVQIELIFKTDQSTLGFFILPVHLNEAELLYYGLKFNQFWKEDF